MDLVYVLVTAAGAGLFWWRHVRAHSTRTPPFDEAVEIVVHVAQHEATARGASAVQALHLLYALLQDERVQGAANKLRANLAAIESWIVEALETFPPEVKKRKATARYSLEAARVLHGAIMVARGAGRSVTLVDLFAALARSVPSVEVACGAGGVRALELLFVLVHGFPETEQRVPDGAELTIVLVNDDVSTMELVVEVLQRDLALAYERAVELMLRVHQTGSAEVGRFPAEMARDRVRSATARARSGGYPLLVRLDS